MYSTRYASRRGTTLTELLVVLVVLGLLATLAIPVAISQANQSRFQIARTEVRSLATGEELVASHHGFYVALQMLDDVITDFSQRDFNSDDLENEPTTMQLIESGVNVIDQAGAGGQLTLSSNEPSVTVMRRTWAGPFVQFQRVFIGGDFLSTTGAGSSQLNASQVRRDYPMDPWGRPYRLYSPVGIVGSGTGTNNDSTTEQELDTDSFSNGNLTSIDDRFDRFAVVSFGPDGISDNTTTSGGTAGSPILGDDIIYIFGAVVPRNETADSVSPVVNPRRRF